jgi:hypothetical protein
VLSAVAGLLYLASMLSRLGGHLIRYMLEAARHVYDIYIVIPLQIEKMVGNGRTAELATVPAVAPNGASLKQEVRR